MTPCSVNGNRTVRLTKVEQKRLTDASELLLHLAIYDQTLNDTATALHAAVGRVDESGVYVPRGNQS